MVSIKKGKRVSTHNIDLTLYERDAEGEGIDPSTDVPVNYDPPNNTELNELIETAVHEKYPAYVASARSTSSDK